MPFIVYLKNGRSVRITAPDADVAIFRVRKIGFDAVSARPWQAD